MTTKQQFDDARRILTSIIYPPVSDIDDKIKKPINITQIFKDLDDKRHYRIMLLEDFPEDFKKKSKKKKKKKKKKKPNPTTEDWTCEGCNTFFENDIRHGQMCINCEDESKSQSVDEGAVYLRNHIIKEQRKYKSAIRIQKHLRGFLVRYPYIYMGTTLVQVTKDCKEYEVHHGTPKGYVKVSNM